MTPASATAEKHVASYQIRLDGTERKPELMNALGEIKIVDSLMNSWSRPEPSRTKSP